MNLTLLTNLNAQSVQDSFELILVNKWIVQNTIKTEDFSPLKSAKIIIEFKQNHVYTANFSGNDENGIWELDLPNKTIKLKEGKSKEFVIFSVIELSQSKCLFRLNKKNSILDLILSKYS